MWSNTQVQTNEFSLEINDYHVEEYFMTKKEDNGGYTNNVNVVLVVPAIFGFDPWIYVNNK